MLRVVCASANPHKVAEISDLMSGVVDLQPRPTELADVVEDADTLVGNARLKAMAVSLTTGLPALADDTGLDVDALNGQPGVFTARFAGVGATDAQNRAKLLHLLDGVTNRAARFRTIVLLRLPSGQEIICEGVCEGSISVAELGERGFGYDSVFVPASSDGKTFAQMSIAEKHEISHRGKAFRLLATRLGELPTA
ncbi:MAG: RdgB/HAM1 family non-canonical purine NTP pyrophosphatase [Actinomycetota bacterium]|nr:RdgB/HAM1 family non-canonical purine NTP pyrophosphatase [Actinomycetota bacterium]MDA3003851.1 RdgB/HAM1 family non-canonical purine NTP pyrophosphatase [Actinomycetota bacterium]